MIKKNVLKTHAFNLISTNIEIKVTYLLISYFKY